MVSSQYWRSMMLLMIISNIFHQKIRNLIHRGLQLFSFSSTSNRTFAFMKGQIKCESPFIQGAVRAAVVGAALQSRENFPSTVESKIQSAASKSNWLVRSGILFLCFVCCALEVQFEINLHVGGCNAKLLTSHFQIIYYHNSI